MNCTGFINWILNWNREIKKVKKKKKFEEKKFPTRREIPWLQGNFYQPLVYVFFKFYKISISIFWSVCKTGTIHNLLHNPIKFQSPDQECSLAFGLIVSSFIVARIALQDQCQLVLCHARWSGARSPHCGADPLPSVRRLSQIFLVPFHHWSR